MRGEVIALNGTSSAGKSTLAAEMQTQLVARNRCWVILGIDDFLGKLPAPWVRYLEAGSHAEAARRGLQRLEGKTYVVEDGDVLNIRFNV